jgi:hypothetical protein
MNLIVGVWPVYVEVVTHACTHTRMHARMHTWDRLPSFAKCWKYLKNAPISAHFIYKCPFVHKSMQWLKRNCRVSDVSSKRLQQPTLLRRTYSYNKIYKTISRNEDDILFTQQIPWTVAFVSSSSKSTSYVMYCWRKYDLQMSIIRLEEYTWWLELW